jgi:HlyD family secretion protein
MNVRQRWLLAGAFAIVVCAAIAWIALRPRPTSDVSASGTIEVTQSDLASKVQGRLVALRVPDGGAVRKGEVVAVLEGVIQSLDLAGARAGVAAAQQQLTVATARLGQSAENLSLTTSATALGIDQAQAALASATASLELAKANLSRARSLVATGDEARQTLDDAAGAYSVAVAQYDDARAALALAKANVRNVGVRRLDVRASQMLASAAAANLAQARANLGLARNAVRETDLVAPYDGYVVAHGPEVGDLVQPGAPVITIGDLEHPYVYVYVSETDLPKVKTGMTAAVTVDGLPNHHFTGTVTQIATSAEFTPENVQTEEQRIQYLVFRVKIQLADRTGTLKPGLPVNAVIHV